MTLDELFAIAPGRTFNALLAITSGAHLGSYLIPLTYQAGAFKPGEIRETFTLSGQYEYEKFGGRTPGGESISLSIVRTELEINLVGRDEPAGTFDVVVTNLDFSFRGTITTMIAQFVPDTSAARDPLCQDAAAYFTSGGASPLVSCCILG